MHDIKMVTETEARLSTHEQICAERYEGIQARFDELTCDLPRLFDGDDPFGAPAA